MSRYDMEQAALMGLVDTVGSEPPLEVDRKFRERGPVDPAVGEPLPMTWNVWLTGGIDYSARLEYAFRLAEFFRGPWSSHYWDERDIFSQKSRLEERKKNIRSEESVHEYEMNRQNYEEYAASMFLVLGGFGSSSGHYRYGEVEQITDLLAKRATIQEAMTIVVPVLDEDLPEFDEYVHFKLVVRPQYEQFEL